MYGFKPRHAQGKPVQNLADGGIVHSITGMLGMRERTPDELRAADAKAQARNREAAAAVAERRSRQEAQIAAAQPQNAISQYSGLSAMQRREKEQGLADGGIVKPRGFKAGGMVRGPGTGTSDSIPKDVPPGTFILPADSTKAVKNVPVQLSNGELEVAPEMVRAIGAAVLAAINGSDKGGKDEAGEYDTPIGKTDDGRKQYTCDKCGGAGCDDCTDGVWTEGDEESDGDADKDHDADGDGDKAQEVGTAVLMALKSLTHETAEGGKAEGQEQATGIEDEGGRPDEPVRPSGFKPRQFFASGGMVKDEEEDGFGSSGKFAKVPDGIGNQPGRTPTPIAPVVQAPTAAPIQPAQPEISPLHSKHSEGGRSGGAMLAEGIENGARSFFDSFQKKPADQIPAAPAAAIQPSGLPGYKTDAQRGGANVPASVVAPSPAQIPVPASSDTPAKPSTVVPGVFQHGRGQYSDNAADMGFNPNFTGQPNAQNMGAADSLAARGFAPGAVAAPAAQGGVTAPTVRNSSNDWAARNNLRNLEVSASSITNQPGRWSSYGKKGGISPAVAAYQAALQTDAALQQAQPGADISAMRENAGIQREGMQQQGATTRTGMQERGSMGRTMAQAALEQQKINQSGESQGFANRAAAQSEQLRNVLLDPNATPEQRSVAQRNLAALSGNTEDARKNVVTLGGGQEWDAQANAMRNVPQRAIDLRTGQEIGARAGAAGQGGKTTQQFKQGEVYRDAAGNTRRWNGTAWERA